MKSFANADEPEKLERLCRYISRPAISEQRLSMTDHGKVRYELKTPLRAPPSEQHANDFNIQRDFNFGA